MSSELDSSSNMFLFQWNIENFDLYYQKRSEYIISPIFNVGALKDAQFVLKLYPKENEIENAMSCFLERIDENTKSIYLSFEVVMEDRLSNSNIKKSDRIRIFDEKNRSWASSPLISFDDVIENRTYFVNNILTVKCYVWVIEFDHKPVDEKSILKYLNVSDIIRDCTIANKSQMTESGDTSEFSDCAVKVSDKKYFLCPYKLEAHTCIPRERKSFKWAINHFSSCLSSEKISIPIQLQSNMDPALELVIDFQNPSEDEVAKIEICRKKDAWKECFLLKSNIAVVVNATGRVSSQGIMHYFDSEESALPFPSIIKKNMVTVEKDFYVPNDVLTLFCEFTISRGPIKTTISNTSFKSIEFQNLVFIEESSDTNIKNDFCQLYEDQELSDVDLKVGNVIFKAHKVVLSARSDVFKRMFQTKMKEQEENAADIHGISADIVKIMLKFMYTDCLDSLDMDKAIELYEAAERYNLPKLKKMCFNYIKKNMTISDFYEVLRLAELHSDYELESIALDIICMNKQKILPSKDWLNFMKLYPRLSRTVLYKVCAKLPEL